LTTIAMIYLDNHASTRCDPRVVEAMLPWLAEHFGNPHSDSHSYGRESGEVIAQSVAELASMLGAAAESIVITSGATESNNLAIRGVCTHPRQKRRHIVTATTEHPAVLDVVTELEQEGFRVTRVGVRPAGDPAAGVIDLDQLADAVDDDTALVSIMWANNEIGAIAPMNAVAEICHARGALLHSDATQAVGRMPVDVQAVDVDLISATAHKFYGPKGTGLLVVGNGNRRVRLKPQIVGGGQQRNLRSGTMNPAGTVGLTTALGLCLDDMSGQQSRVGQLRDDLYRQLCDAIDGIEPNGPSLSGHDRLPGNLNLVLPGVEGSAWMTATPAVAFSSGSACSSVEAKPSHVLTALGLSESEARRSVRFGVGRFNTADEINDASKQLIDSYQRLATQLGS
jgi:cysteine desulfurase